jgi:Icc-related predicted phosphoesterase
MKLYVTSDIHLEFGDLDLENKHEVDVLILSGDICVARDLDRLDVNLMTESARSSQVKNFFSRCSSRFPHVLYVMGNHEHYHGDFSETADILRKMLKDNGLDNVRLLDKETVDINDVTFIGGTLWTDFNRHDPLTMQHAQHFMNDFRGVKHRAKGRAGGNWKFLPEDAYDDHQSMLQYLEQVFAQRQQQQLTNPVVVVGHHAPSPASTHPKYKTEYHMNGCYSSNLEQFILNHRDICLWTHGHTHEDFDYMIGTTRVVCNPRGYVNYEERAEHWQPKLVKIEHGALLSS